MLHKYTKILLLLLFLEVIVGCSSSKHSLTYFEDIKNTDFGESVVSIPELHIVPDDVLLITVNSLEPEATEPYNMPLINPSSRSNKYLSVNPQQQTYIVDSKGYITLPIIGKLKVEGYTVGELAMEITRRIEDDVIDPYVRVELINFNVQVLGEVNHPGTIKVDRNQLSILDALAAAGDITAYGEKSNVLLIRQENGQNKYFHLNLNDSNTLSSPLFYLKQNDVIIVEPNDIRKANARYNQDNAYKLSVISTIVSATSVVASLAIALAVR